MPGIVFAFNDLFTKFGITKISDIDLPFERDTKLRTTNEYDRSRIYKATSSYGYGLQTNFTQLLKAYNVFNNNGKLIKPSIGEFLKSKANKQKIEIKEKKTILDLEVAKTMKKVLIKTVNEGTGKNAITAGIIVGGKTGTAQIAEKGVYEEIYNSSFFGFANDNNNSYTIGVTVIQPNPKGPQHYTSGSATPVFKEIVDTLVDKGFLKVMK